MLILRLNIMQLFLDAIMFKAFTKNHQTFLSRRAAPAAASPAVAPSGGMTCGKVPSMAIPMATGTRQLAVANRAADAGMGPRQPEVVHLHDQVWEN